MSTQFDARSYGLGALLSRSEKKKLTVPQFQRGYSWEDSHVETFITDLLTFMDSKKKREGYFLGPVVIMPAQTLRVLDGQQRVATTTIAFAVLRDLAFELATTEGKRMAEDLQRQYITKTRSGFAVELGEEDELFFRNHIQRHPRRVTAVELRSHQRIASAYKRIEASMRARVEGLSDPAKQKLLNRFGDVLTQELRIVQISVSSEDAAFMIFETLNDRGLRLSVPDLLLNHLMSKAPNSEARKHVRQEWAQMLDRMGKRDIAQFLRHMWVSLHGDIKSQSLFRAIKSSLQEGTLDPQTFAESCADECEAYMDLLDVNTAKLKGAHDYVRSIVKNLEIPSSYPLLLAGLRSLSNAQFQRLLKAMIQLVVRYAVISNLSPNDLETVLFEAAKTVRSRRALGINDRVVVNEVIAELRAIDPADELVREAASKAILTRARATFVITEIAKKQLNKPELEFASPTIEHIFPQKASEDKWPMKKDLEPYVWHLGNLTLLSEKINGKAGEKSYDTKRDSHYRTSDVPMTAELAEAYPIWNVDAISARGTEMAEEILALWPRLT